MIDALLDSLSKVSEVPRPVWAITAGLFAGFGVTQRLRRLLPDVWDDKTHEVATQALVFVVAFAVTFLSWGNTGNDAIVGALVAGLITPAAWNVLLAVIGWWKPDLRDALMQRTK